jgi:hypothetical protein
MAIVSGRENNHSPTMGALANFAAQILRLTLRKHSRAGRLQLNRRRHARHHRCSALASCDEQERANTDTEVPPPRISAKAALSANQNYFSVTSRMSLPPMMSRISRRLIASWRCWSSVPTNLAPIESVLSRRPSRAAMFGYSIMSRIS